MSSRLLDPKPRTDPIASTLLCGTGRSVLTRMSAGRHTSFDVHNAESLTGTESSRLSAAPDQLENAAAGIMGQFRLDGMVVVVTGAGKGIGRGIATAAAAAGATVVGCSRTSDDLATLEAEIREAGGECSTVVVDLTERAGLDELFEFAVQTGGGQVHAVVNNAGVNLLRDALDYSESEVDDILNLNLRAVYWSCIRAARTMIDTSVRGSILNITSQASVAAAPGRAPYSAAKAGVNHLTRTLAAEWAEHGIRVNALAPTVTATPLGKRAMEQRPEFAAEVQRRIALVGRPATIEEISLPATFLLSPAAALITGQTIVVDGGWTL